MGAGLPFPEAQPWQRSPQYELFVVRITHQLPPMGTCRALNLVNGEENFELMDLWWYIVDAMQQAGGFVGKILEALNVR